MVTAAWASYSVYSPHLNQKKQECYTSKLTVFWFYMSVPKLLIWFLFHTAFLFLVLIWVGFRENWDIFVGRCFLNKLMVVTLYCPSLYCFVEIFFAPLPQPTKIIFRFWHIHVSNDYSKSSYKLIRVTVHL